jgi:HAD superfamily hydrolase (TIGR01509 family)
VIRNILWDVDGTLLDTYPVITYAISKTLTEMGVLTPLNVIDGLARQSLEGCLATLSQRFKLNPDLLRLRFAESYRTVPPANQPPFPGAREVCTLIHANGGLNIIVTHRAVSSTQSLLEAHEMASLFDAIFSVEQGYPRKPDPAMLEAAIQQFGLERAQTLVIGDRDLDIQAGRAAGVRTCLFGNSLLSEPADYHFDRYDQLLDLLKNSSE